MSADEYTSVCMRCHKDVGYKNILYRIPWLIPITEYDFALILCDKCVNEYAEDEKKITENTIKELKLLVGSYGLMIKD